MDRLPPGVEQGSLQAAGDHLPGRAVKCHNSRPVLPCSPLQMLEQYAETCRSCFQSHFCRDEVPTKWRGENGFRETAVALLFVVLLPVPSASSRKCNCIDAHLLADPPALLPQCARASRQTAPPRHRRRQQRQNPSSGPRPSHHPRHRLRHLLASQPHQLSRQPSRLPLSSSLHSQGAHRRRHRRPSSSHSSQRQALPPPQAPCRSRARGGPPTAVQRRRPLRPGAHAAVLVCLRQCCCGRRLLV